MKEIARNWPWGIAALVVGFVVPMELAGGEAIQFSNARNRQDPTAKSKLPGDKEGDRVGRLSPLDFMQSGGDGARRDPARDRKAKNAAAERNNWMVLNRGELDEKDEAKRASGMRDVSFEKEPDQKDYFFTPVHEKDGTQRASFARPFDRDRSEPEADTKEPAGLGGKVEENSETRRTQVFDKNGRALGEHTASELDLKDLLSSGKANSLAPAGDRTALLWKDVLGGSGDSGGGRRHDDTTTADSFRGSVSAGPARASDSFSLRSDLHARASASMPAGLAESAPRNFSLPALPVAPRASDSAFGRGPGLYGTPSASDSHASSPGGLGGDPYSSYRPPPQRSSSGNFQIPSRPGYGGR